MDNEQDKILELELIIHGRVQGIFLRQGIKEFCDNLGLKGFVLNRKDGSVKIIAQGKKEELEKLIAWLRNNPGMAQIEKIDVKWQEPLEKYRDFKILLNL